MELRKRGRPRGRTVGPQYALRLPPDLDTVLHRVAEREDRPAAGIVRQALRQYLADDLAQAAAEDEEEVIARAS